MIGKRGGQALDGNLQRVTASVTASEAPSRSSKSEWLVEGVSEVWWMYKRKWWRESSCKARVGSVC